MLNYLIIYCVFKKKNAIKSWERFVEKTWNNIFFHPRHRVQTHLKWRLLKKKYQSGEEWKNISKSPWRQAGSERKHVAQVRVHKGMSQSQKVYEGHFCIESDIALL